MRPADELLEEGQASSRQPVVFFEKLYRHDQILSPLLFKLNDLVANGAGTPSYFDETCDFKGFFRCGSHFVAESS